MEIPRCCAKEWQAFWLLSERPSKIILPFSQFCALTYAIEIVHVADRDEESLRVAYNAIFRKIFSYKHFESVTALQHRLKRKTWEEVVSNCQTQFVKRAKACDRHSCVQLRDGHTIVASIISNAMICTHWHTFCIDFYILIFNLPF